MYKSNRNRQISLSDFNQPVGLKMNPENRWIKRAETIPWMEIEERYAALFPSNTGMPAKPLQVALGSLIIQKQYDYSDRELVEQIRENPYYQYFIGLPGYQDKAPYVPSLLVEFRKRLTDDILAEINEMIAEYNTPDDPSGPSAGSDDGDDGPGETRGTLILDATCAPQQISYPQDVNLLNEARENLESIIDDICYEFNYYKPRMYRQNARNDYLALAKCRKRSAKKIRKAIKKQLQYVKRDLGHIDLLMEQDDIRFTDRQLQRINIIRELFRQQEYMYRSNTHSVKDRIVSISQPYIRPIVRGKAKSPTEFGAKLDMSIDETGFARLERLSFDAYNESDVLIETIENYRQRTGHYPERVLVDQIYRNRSNRAYCRENGIRISGPALGRPRQLSKEEKLQSYIDNTDRIEVERGFSLAKRCYGMGLIRTKLDTTTRSSIALSILAMNVNHLAAIHFWQYMISIFSRFSWQKYLPKNLSSGCCIQMASC
jgi:IS5 family transposase